jgi:hypothetical protein
MSGHKRATVKLGRHDLQRIEQLASQLRQVEHDYQQVQKNIQKERQEQLALFNDQLQDRLETFSDLAGNYHAQIGRIETQTGQALADQAYALQERILAHQNLLTQNTNTLIEQHVQALHLSLQENQQALREHFDGLRRTVSRIESEQERRFYLAMDAVQAAEALIHSIDQVYDHGRYFPHALERLDEQHALAVRNLQDGMPEACLALAQQVTQQASILRMSIEEILQKTALIQTLAIEKARELHETIQSNAVVPAIDLQGNELEIPIDVDFWTCGRWGGLLRRCEKFLDQMQSATDDLDYEDIDRILKFILPQLEQSLQDVVAQARMKVILSQIRFNIAECVLDALGEQGFEARQAWYAGQDERQPYQVVARNLDGSEVHVFIDSDEPAGAYTIQVDSFEAFPAQKPSCASDRARFSAACTTWA